MVCEKPQAYEKERRSLRGMNIAEQKRKLSEFADKEFEEHRSFLEASKVGSDPRDAMLVEIIRSGIKGFKKE